MSRPARLSGVCLSLALLLPASLLLAHKGRHPETLRALLKADGLTVAAQVSSEGGQESRELRRRFDEDGDGRLDRTERDAALDALQADLLSRIRARIDRSDLRAELSRRDGLGWMGPVAAPEPVSASFQFQFAFHLPAGRHRLVLQARSATAGTDLPLFFQIGRGLELDEHNAVPVGSKHPTLKALLDPHHPLTVSFRLPASAD